MNGAAAVALVVVAFAGNVGTGDPEVRPDEYLPSVRVEAESELPSSNRSATNGEVAQPKSNQIPDRCFIDLSDPNYRCALPSLGDDAVEGRAVQPGDILTAAREVGMPPLELQVQPDGETLVNVETIFYTDPTVLRRTVTLLGRTVRLECTPVRFTWVHGDGTTASTSKPGRPYPAKDVTHRYEQPDDNVGARVDTTYRVRYSVDGGGWATLDETLTARGPVTAIDVDEAAPVLTR